MNEEPICDASQVTKSAKTTLVCLERCLFSRFTNKSLLEKKAHFHLVINTFENAGFPPSVVYVFPNKNIADIASQHQHQAGSRCSFLYIPYAPMELVIQQKCPQVSQYSCLDLIYKKCNTLTSRFVLQFLILFSSDDSHTEVQNTVIFCLLHF